MAEICSRSTLSGRCAFGVGGHCCPGRFARAYSEHDDSGRTDCQLGDRESARRAGLFLLSTPTLSHDSHSIHALVTSMDAVWIVATNRVSEPGAVATGFCHPPLINYCTTVG